MLIAPGAVSPGTLTVVVIESFLTSVDRFVESEKSPPVFQVAFEFELVWPTLRLASAKNVLRLAP